MTTSNYRESNLNSGYTDMSHLVPSDVGLTGGASMSGGNTISTPPPPGAGGAPGSEPVNPRPKGAVSDDPSMDIGPVHNYIQKAGK